MSLGYSPVNWFAQAHTEASAEAAWETWQAPYRQHVIQALACLPNVKSMYEIGCGAGPNLRIVRNAFPSILIGGSEPSPVDRSWAAKQLNVSLDAGELPETPASRWDAVLSCYVLAYAAEDLITAWLRALPASTLIVMELAKREGPPMVHQGGTIPHYHHNYDRLLAATGWHLKWAWPLPFENCAKSPNLLLIAERRASGNGIH